MSTLKDQVGNGRVSGAVRDGTHTRSRKASRRRAERFARASDLLISTLENETTYRDLEADIAHALPPRNGIEQELVARLASLLWRLRRATAIEAGLFRLQAEFFSERRTSGRAKSAKTSASLYKILGLVEAPSGTRTGVKSPMRSGGRGLTSDGDNCPNPWERDDIARCFLRLAYLDVAPLEKIRGYEATLWRQAREVMALLRAMQASSGRT